MRGFLQAFDDLTRQVHATGRAQEIGCGEGELSLRLARAGWTVSGCDIASEAVQEARARAASAGLAIPFRVLDIHDAAGELESADLVICCEVLEHLDDPIEALRILASLSSRHVLVSVPREPIWRCLNIARGRYIADLGNTPGHVQHWSSKAFLAMLGEQLDVLAVRTPLPWTMALCRVRHD
jgi:2-polyprenyl-3-methyl-5-hydroxy-6-metoxy-1,4-benzoquinol methylase